MTDTQVQDMKRFLKSYRTLCRVETLLRMRLSDLERMARLPVLHKKDPDPEQLAARMAHCRQELADLAEQKLKRCREIEETIGRLDGNGADKTMVYRQILRLHYLDGLTFCEIADHLHYHERHVRRLHREALEAAAQKGADAHGVD